MREVISYTPGYIYLRKEKLLYAFEKFIDLDVLDLKIIELFISSNPRNISSIAEKLGVSQQTVSYRINRLDRLGVLDCRAEINYEKLGLEAYTLLVTGSLSEQNYIEAIITPIPLWRYLITLDGYMGHVFLVEYVLPPSGVEDLKMYFNWLLDRNEIGSFYLYKTTEFFSTNINWDYYIKLAEKDKKYILDRFDWNQWLENIQPSNKKFNFKDNIRFTMRDLLFLSFLEIDARMKLKDIARKISDMLEINSDIRPWLSKRLRFYISNKVISGYRSFLRPVNPKLGLPILLYITFSSPEYLKGFLSSLSKLPYSSVYSVLDDYLGMFVILYFPSTAFDKFRECLMILSNKGIVRKTHFFIGSWNRIWKNVLVYKAYDGKNWLTDKDIFIEAYYRIKEDYKKYPDKYEPRGVSI